MSYVNHWARPGPTGVRKRRGALPLPVTEATWESSPVATWKTTRTDKPSRVESPVRVSDLLRLPAGRVDLNAIATGATPGFIGSGKADGKREAQ